ncbi:MAG: hypothetical protein ACHQFZ_06740 [Acidimicrobiales bacterium]
MTPRTRDVLAHLGACFAAPYRVLGAAAPAFSDDGAVVRAYEAARACGEVALAIGDRLGQPPPPLAPVAAVLSSAVEQDPTGRLALYALAVVVGPRLLVSLRDARGEVDEDAVGLLDHASDLIVGEIVAIRDLAVSRPDAPSGADRGAARALAEALDGAGYAESLGPDR